jgi:hypothetical protein
MKFYLRVLNPIVALAVLLLCLWAGAHDMEGNWNPEIMFKSLFNTYFVAKGLFCSSALFILGVMAQRLLGLDAKPDAGDSSDEA